MSKAKEESIVKKTGKVAKKKATVQVSATNLPGAEELHKEEKIEIRPFATDPANVSVKLGFTKNIGNFESIRGDVMVSVPCYIEEIPDLLKQTEMVVDKFIDTLHQKIDGTSPSPEVKETKKESNPVTEGKVDPGDLSIEDLIG